MRKAFEKLGHLYSTNSTFQDLIETVGYGTAIAAGQALLTDMTPEEIALASLVGGGAAMAGRPVMGYAGRKLGGLLDKHAPEMGKSTIEFLQKSAEQGPQFAQNLYNAKMGPYAHMGGATQLGNAFGRQYGDNLGQALIAFSAPGILSGEDNAA